MKFATITPDRGDRPQLLEFCKHQLSRMNTPPDRSYYICTDPSPDGRVDIVPRIREGIRRAKQDGFDLVFIIENDDYYPKTYFDHLPDADFYGANRTTYYNLRNHTWQTWSHPGRASLFTTGFKISSFERVIKWPEDNLNYLDIHLWKQFTSVWGYKPQNYKISTQERAAVGIKHGIGKLGGNGHTMTMKNRDNDFSWLKKSVDPQAFIFYSTLKPL
jgi:hypothetical protein